MLIRHSLVLVHALAWLRGLRASGTTMSAQTCPSYYGTMLRTLSYGSYEYGVLFTVLRDDYSVN